MKNPISHNGSYIALFQTSFEQRLIFQNEVPASIPEAESVSPKSVETLKKELETAREEETNFLSRFEQKTRIGVVRYSPFFKINFGKEGKTNLLRFVFLANADTRYEPDSKGAMRKLVDKAHDTFLRINWRGFTEEEYVRSSIKTFIDYFERIFDNIQTELFIDDEHLGHQDMVDFFNIQIRLAEAELALLKTRPSHSVTDKEIGILEEAITLYREIITRAENALLLNRRITLKNSIEEERTEMT